MLMYPPSERTARATLSEVQACARAGIQLSTFALIEDYFYLGLMNFVDQMARTGQGVAVYCNAGELGRLSWKASSGAAVPAVPVPFQTSPLAV